MLFIAAAMEQYGILLYVSRLRLDSQVNTEESEKDEKWDELNYSNKELLELKKIIQSSSVLVFIRNEISTQQCTE